MKALPVKLLSLLLAAAFVVGIFRIPILKNIYKEDERYGIEKLLPISSETNSNIYGDVYTIDGERMLEYAHYHTYETIPYIKEDGTSGEYFKRNKIVGRERTDDDIDLYYPTDPAYASILGIRGINGLLEQVKGVLTSDVLSINRELNQGDSIITTIHSKAQKEAVRQLSRFRGYYREFVDDPLVLNINGTDIEFHNNTTASMAIVSSDGAILVSAGTNTFETQDYITKLDQYNQDTTRDYPCMDDMPLLAHNLPLDQVDFVGSSFKPVTARVIEQRNDLLSPEFSIYNKSFHDVSPFTYNDTEYHNHDDWDPNEADREISLEQAFVKSSNLYFMRHALELGINEYCDSLDKLFMLNQKVYTDVYYLKPMDFNNIDKPEMIAYGQSAALSPVHLATLYNTLLFSGDFYTPSLACEIRDPELGIIYHLNTNEHKTHKFDVEKDENGSNIIVDSLKATLPHYLAEKREGIDADIEGIPEGLLTSGRVLCKSGTADRIDYHVINRTMCVSILNKEKNAVICTGVIAINNLNNEHDLKGDTNNYVLIKMLLETMSKLEGVLE